MTAKAYDHLNSGWLYEEPKYMVAWTDLLRKTEPVDRVVRRNHKKTTLKAGIAYVSKRELCRLWGWGFESVETFLNRLEASGLIKVSSESRKQTEITIVSRLTFTPDPKNERLLSDMIGTNGFPKIGKPTVDIVVEASSLDNETDDEEQFGEQNGEQFELQNELQNGEQFRTPEKAESSLSSSSSSRMESRSESRSSLLGGEYKEGGSLIDKNINNSTDSLKGDKEGVGEKGGRKLPERYTRPIGDPTQKVVRFKKPTPEEVIAYCKERNNGLDGQRIFDYYESLGWKRGKAQIPIKDWRACVRTWESNKKYGYSDYIENTIGWNNPRAKKASGFKNFEERETDYDDLIRQLGEN